MILQQGDILIKRVGDFDEKFTMKADLWTKQSRYAVDEGETTGHIHEAIGDELFIKDDIDSSVGVGNIHRLLIASRFTFVIEHPEHKEIQIPEGIWSFEKVKEFDHFGYGILEVRD